MKVKICGLTRPEDIAAVNACLPDYIGFVFAPSRRRVTVEQARQLKQALDPRIQSVGVFVDAGLDDIAPASAFLDLIQLHGSESDDFVRQVKRLYSLPVIKALPVGSAGAPPADFYLFDGPQPGSGQRFDWSMLSSYTTPYFLAGGLSAHNIALAATCKPYCLDVSSGVETNGMKDHEKILQFVSTVRRLP
ncbi:MAG: phosphoribosylanthranilate isomerase [Oscillospiraceae bacterium]|nr:phosphoribosylanthranilate isomerase [Oscillospiraceae bacterium]